MLIGKCGWCGIPMANKASNQTGVTTGMCASCKEIQLQKAKTYFSKKDPLILARFNWGHYSILDPFWDPLLF
jgi:hypothetical protein